jgi:hypothetical protein
MKILRKILQIMSHSFNKHHLILSVILLAPAVILLPYLMVKLSQLKSKLCLDI